MRTSLMASVLAAALLAAQSSFGFTNDQIARMEAKAKGLSTGERIALYAEAFVGTPYDPDPLGEYVSKKRIVADDHVDCMYQVFRSVELALSNTPEGAVREALHLRFKTEGRLAPDGTVLNYDDRFQYALDMLRSGKWGRDITAALGPTVRIRGARGVPFVNIIPKEEIGGILPRLQSGTIIYFVKDPEKRIVGEVIGHLGIIKREGSSVYLIHASGTKHNGGIVKKVLFAGYARTMPFIGIMAGSFD